MLRRRADSVCAGGTPSRSTRPLCGHPSRRRFAAPQDEVWLCGLCRYCAACLIAQETCTVTDNVSWPGAIGVPAIGAAAILAWNTGAGATPFSEMLSGAPSVTPAALA